MALSNDIDSLVKIKCFGVGGGGSNAVSWQDAFRLADDVLRQGVHAISELVTIPGEINLDFADVRNVMSNSGQALMAIGHGRGSSRAIDAAKQAIANPLLEVDITGAKGVLFNISAGADLALAEIHAAADVIAQSVDPDANIIFGVVPDPKSDGEVRLTLIATGFQTTEQGMMEDDRVVDQILREALGDADLDLPPFLRRKSRRLAR
jgi:cell division protein FtsZ